jgi:hypothetical protein
MSFVFGTHVREFTPDEIATIQRAQIESLRGRTPKTLPAVITQNNLFANSRHLAPSPQRWFDESHFFTIDTRTVMPNEGGHDWTDRELLFIPNFAISQPSLLFYLDPIDIDDDNEIVFSQLRSRLAAIRYGDFWNIQFLFGPQIIFRLPGALNSMLLKLQDHKQKQRGSYLFVFLRICLGQCKLVADLITSFALLGENDGDAALVYVDKMPCALATILQSLQVMKVPLVCDLANFVVPFTPYSSMQFRLVQSSTIPSNVSTRVWPIMHFKRFEHFNYGGRSMHCDGRMKRLFSSIISTGFEFCSQSEELIHDFRLSRCNFDVPFSALLLRIQGITDDHRRVDVSVVSLSIILVPYGKFWTYYSLGDGWYCFPARNCKLVSLDKALFGVEWNESETHDHANSISSDILVSCQLQTPSKIQVELFYRGANVLIGDGGLLNLLWSH